VTARIAWRLLPLTWAEWHHHALRHIVALLAVALGVALAYSVHLINESALGEFAAAVRSANGQPDLSLRGQREGFDDALFAELAADERVAAASPVLEIETYLRRADGSRVAVKVLGVDALRLPALAPALMPRPDAGVDGQSTLDPLAVFANPAALAAVSEAAASGPPRAAETMLELQSGPEWRRWRLAGTVAAGGGPTLVMDLAGAQAGFGREGRLSRIDLRLQPGESAARYVPPEGTARELIATLPGDDEQRISKLSRAYRVNLTVLALVALLVGAFLVYSVLALAVAQRAPQLALLGVLGLSARERSRWVLLESALLGVIGSGLGLIVGAALAFAALRWLAGDLGGGYFPGVVPQLRWHPGSMAVFGGLGVVAAMLGGWWPARQAASLAPAQALKGLGQSHRTPQRHLAMGVAALLVAGCGLALMPPVAGLPLAAYLSVACLLLGGVAAVPLVVRLLLVLAWTPKSPLAMLALERARFARHTATAAVAGVVASLALSVALTVMVASFRDGVSQWLDQVLPADLYARSAGSAAAAEQAWFDTALLARAATIPGVARVEGSRSRSLQLAAGQPAVTLIARPIAQVGGAMQALPMVSAPLKAAAGVPAVYVSEAMVSLHGARPGTRMLLPLRNSAGSEGLEVQVLGVWRDYARQFGTIAIDLEDYRRLTGDTKVTDLALWLVPGSTPEAVQAAQAALRALPGDAAMVETLAATELRSMSLRIFDRSFAVTRYLQGIAIAIGMIGVAASLAAQVLSRRKEFGLLAHLGLTRRDVRAVVVGETAAWMAAGVAIGLALGLAISAVLVHVVNPQSFHWRMALVVPEWRLALLALVVWCVGVVTALLAARGAVGRAAVISVREDW
jgi:putative ABC transport system permease protein